MTSLCTYPNLQDKKQVEDSNSQYQHQNYFLAKTVGESLYSEMIEPTLNITEYPICLLFENGSPLEVFISSMYISVHPISL